MFLNTLGINMKFKFLAKDDIPKLTKQRNTFFEVLGENEEEKTPLIITNCVSVLLCEHLKVEWSEIYSVF